MNYKESIVDAIGNTPLIKLNNLAKGLKPTILVKLEAANPTGSMKDRIAKQIIEDAEKDGHLKPGGTIVEATGSANTGIGLAMIARVKGYKVKVSAPDKISTEKEAMLKALGAEVVKCPTHVAPEDPESYYKVAKRIVKETPGAFYAGQYENPSNPKAHYVSTGPEIWEDTEGKITHYVAGIGTGGSMSGVAKFLKEKNPNIKVVCPDPIGSIYYPTIYKTDDKVHQYVTEGIGEDFIPKTVDLSLVDELIRVTDYDCLSMTKEVAKQEGLFVGGSCGGAIFAALKLAKTLSKDDVIVVLLPDTGRNYLSKIFNEKWYKGNVEDKRRQ